MESKLQARNPNETSPLLSERSRTIMQSFRGMNNRERVHILSTDLKTLPTDLTIIRLILLRYLRTWSACPHSASISVSPRFSFITNDEMLRRCFNKLHETPSEGIDELLLFLKPESPQFRHRLLTKGPEKYSHIIDWVKENVPVASNEMIIYAQRQFPCYLKIFRKHCEDAPQKLLFSDGNARLCKVGGVYDGYICLPGLYASGLTLTLIGEVLQQVRALLPAHAGVIQIDVMLGFKDMQSLVMRPPWISGPLPSGSLIDVYPYLNSVIETFNLAYGSLNFITRTIPTLPLPLIDGCDIWGYDAIDMDTIISHYRDLVSSTFNRTVNNIEIAACSSAAIHPHEHHFIYSTLEKHPYYKLLTSRA